jgi:uncharacterized membrane protein
MTTTFLSIKIFNYYLYSIIFLLRLSTFIVMILTNTVPAFINWGVEVPAAPCCLEKAEKRKNPKKTMKQTWGKTPLVSALQ